VAMRVRELLTVNNITQYRLEQNCGINHSTLDFIMKSSNKTVNFKTIMQLAIGFNMTLLEFLDSPYFKFENFDLE
jgi:transcriptional regulator with XRE-family HTH domain